MKLFWTSGCFFLLVALRCTSGSSIIREKRQSSLTLNTEVEPRNQETFLLINNRRAVSLSDVTVQALTGVSITCDYDADRFTIRSTIGTQTINSATIMNCLDIDSSGTLNNATSSITSNGGTLYRSPNDMVFIDNAFSGLIGFVNNAIRLAPPLVEPINVQVVERSGELVLNVDDTSAENDNVAETTDDTITLTQSICRDLPEGHNALYDSRVLTVFDGSSESYSVNEIEECFVIRNVRFGRPLFTRLTSSDTSEAVNGPGMVCYGEGRLGGQSACFISNNQSINSMIRTQLLEQQMTYVNVTMQPSGVLQSTRIQGALGSLSGQSVFNIMSGNTQSLSFPSARSIMYANGEVTISDRFGNALRRIGSMGSPATLAYYNNSRLLYFDTTSTEPFITSNIFDGGLQVAITDGTSANPMVFAYPAGNTMITQMIQSALSALPVTTPAPLSYSVQTTVFGTTVLSANNQPIQTVSTTMSIQIEPTQCVVYDSDTASVYEGCDTTMNAVNVVNDITTLNFDDASANRLITYMGSAPSPIQGPGRLYFSGSNGTIVTNPGLINLITEIESQSRPFIGIRRVINAMGNPVAIVDGGGTNLFTFSTTNVTTVNVESGEGILYRNSMVGTAQIVQVPESATVQFADGSASIRENGVVVSNFSVVGTANVQTFPGSTSYVQAMPTQVFPGGGVIYLGDTGTVYNRDGRVSDSLYTAVMTFGGISDEFSSDTLNFYNGRVIQMFMGSAGMVLPGPGIIYMNMGAGQTFYNSDTRFNEVIPSTVSRLVPSTITYVRETGNVEVITSDMTPVTNISVVSQRISVPFGGSATGSESNITIFDSNGNVVRRVSGIDTVITLDGITTMTISITGTDEVMLPSSGTMYIDTTGRRAVQVTETVLNNQISSTINDAFNTFTNTIIPRPTTREVISNLAMVSADFGQTVIVAEGATVRLTCSAGNANPPATFEFLQFENSTNSYIPIENEIGRGGVPNSMFVDITAQFGGTEYLCRATNPLGQATTTSLVIGQRGRAPEIQNNFFTSGTTPGTLAVTATTDVPPLISMPIIGDEMDIDDLSQITDRVIIGCRAKGLPIPSITWTITPPNPIDTPRDVFIDDSIPGQSRLIINLTDVDCLTFTCNASNGIDPDQTAAREICPRIYTQDSGMGNPEDCSGTCGIGVRLITFGYTLETADGTQSLTFEELPEGLFKPTVQFCDNMVTCPVVEIAYGFTDFSDCSAFCGVGRQTREVTCRRIIVSEDNFTIIPDEECKNRSLVRPVDAQSCDAGPCPEYNITSVSPCTRSCRGGVMNQVIECIQFDGNDTEVADIEVCGNHSLQERPLEVVPCNSNIRCPVEYFVARSGPCDLFFCQALNYTCVQNDEPELWPVADEICRDQGLVPGPPVASCGGGICNFGIWRDSAIEGEICSAPCGSGVLKREVVCVDPNTGDVINDRFCNGNFRPPSDRPCFIQNCPGQCDNEPAFCRTVAIFNACKREDLFPDIPLCCKSCPSRAAPIPL